MAEVFKDFLPPDHFAAVQQLFMTERLPWHFNDRVVTTERHFMFTHTFMNDGQVVNPHFFAPIQAMLQPINQRRRYIGVNRIKANLYTNQGKAIQHPEHYDIPPDGQDSERFFVAVYHVNTNNGLTVVEDEEIASIENQLVVFDNVPHFGTVQTDTDTRVVLNFTLRT